MPKLKKMPDARDHLTIEIGQWIKASASGRFAIVGLVAILIERAFGWV